MYGSAGIKKRRVKFQVGHESTKGTDSGKTYIRRKVRVKKSQIDIYHYR
jgi:hypothetical protein